LNLSWDVLRLDLYLFLKILMDFGGLEAGFRRMFNDFKGFWGTRGWILMDF
jgi:hypothetical protein